MNIQDAIRAGQEWVRLRDEAEEHELILTPRDVVENPDLVARAWEVLHSDTPLLDHYPNGSPARPPFTSKQVLLLARIEFMPITHEAKEYQEALDRIRGELGRHAPRPCSGVTKSGSLCQSHALAYSNEQLCSSHASPEEKAYNREMLKKEEEQLKHALEVLGLEAASKTERS